MNLDCSQASIIPILPTLSTESELCACERSHLLGEVQLLNRCVPTSDTCKMFVVSEVDSCRPRQARNFFSSLSDGASLHLPAFLSRIAPELHIEARLRLSLIRRKNMKELLRNMWSDQSGQDVAEYALMLAVIL